MTRKVFKTLRVFLFMNNKNKGLNGKSAQSIPRKDKIIIFFFGTIFVLLIGKHYFANLGGSPGEKSVLLKWYYFGLAFWLCIIVGIGYLNRESL